MEWGVLIGALCKYQCRQEPTILLFLFLFSFLFLYTHPTHFIFLFMHANLPRMNFSSTQTYFLRERNQYADLLENFGVNVTSTQRCASGTKYEIM